MARGFVEALRRHSREVIDLQGEHAEEFLRFLRDTREQLMGRMVGGGDSNPLDAFRMREILAETEVAIRSLEAKAIGRWGKIESDAIDLAMDHIGDELDRLSTAFDAKPINVVLDAQKVLADPAQGLLANHYESSVKKYGLDLLNQARQRVFIGLRTGETTEAVARSIAGPKGALAEFGQANAQRLVRTETSQAYGAAHAKSIGEASKQIPGLKKTWLHVASFPCPTCMPIHGTERPLDGTWTIKGGRRTKEVAHPPAHPNCTCRVAAMKSSWRRGLLDLGYLERQDEGAPVAL